MAVPGELHVLVATHSTTQQLLRLRICVWHLQHIAPAEHLAVQCCYLVLHITLYDLHGSSPAVIRQPNMCMCCASPLSLPTLYQPGSSTLLCMGELHVTLVILDVGSCAPSLLC